MNPEVDIFLSKAKNWQEEMKALRAILLECGLSEKLKWGKPCYMFQKNNIVILYSLKESCAIGFMKGVLLQDSEGILLMPGENSQAGRWVKFTSMQQILAMKNSLKSYIYEAIEVEKAGLKVVFKETSDYVIPEEFQKKLGEDAALKAAFEALTPGRQKGYYLYFSAPKQSKSRAERVEKYTSRILNGKGINDCVCGISKKMPNCDGSHKYLKNEHTIL